MAVLKMQRLGLCALKKNRKEILELLGQLGAEVYLTSEGTVTCVTDGSSLSFSQN